MSVDNSENTYQSLGDLLQQQRVLLGFTLEEIAEETRIALHMLEAMENNAYNKLPAEAFTRGFYVLYAKALQLDRSEILLRYQQEAISQPTRKKRLPPTRKARDISNMAERPTSVPFFYLGLFLFTLLIIGGLLCWYFAWNPATFLSEKLRGVQAPAIEERSAQPPIVSSSSVSVEAPDHSSTATAKVTKINPDNNDETMIIVNTGDTAPPIPAPPPAVSPHYFVGAVFSKPVQVTVTIDSGPTMTQNFKAGERTDWQAGKQVILTLPKDSGITLTVNDLPFTIPPSTTPFITLSIPEDLLQ